jgi:hypothetical protein
MWDLKSYIHIKKNIDKWKIETHFRDDHHVIHLSTEVMFVTQILFFSTVSNLKNDFNLEKMRENFHDNQRNNLNNIFIYTHAFHITKTLDL